MTSESKGFTRIWSVPIRDLCLTLLLRAKLERMRRKKHAPFDTRYVLLRAFLQTLLRVRNRLTLHQHQPCSES